MARVSWPHIACFAGGIVIGVTFGGRVFPQIEAMFGDPATDIAFGLITAFFAMFAYELVAMFRSLD